MSVYNLGTVVGPSGDVNGSSNLSIVGADNGGVNVETSGTSISISADLSKVQAKISGETGQYLSFDANGNAVPVGVGRELYGFELNMDESEPSNMIRYIEDNTSFASAHMDYTNGVFDYGDWGDAFFIKNLKPCMLNYDGSVAYDLDKNDYTKKADGTASDVANSSFAGNAMMGIPTVWVKVDTSVSKKPKFYFSNKQLDPSYKCYAHHDNNGNVMPYTYMSIYAGSYDGTRLRSLTAGSPTRSQTGSQFLSQGRANNPSGSAIWDIGKFIDRQLINLLLLLIGKSTDSKSVFGYGNGTGNTTPLSGLSDSYGVLVNGTLDNKGLFFGYSESQGTNRAVKVFGIENWWGNIWRRDVGLVLYLGNWYYKLTYGTEDGSSVTGFIESSFTEGATPSGWISLGPISGGTLHDHPTVEYRYWTGTATDMYAGPFGLIQKTVIDFIDSRYFSNCLTYRISGTETHFSGSNAASAEKISCFSEDASIGLSYSNWNVGTTLSCKPTVSV